MNKCWSFILLAVLAIVFVSLSANAASKIIGRVTDKSTGSPLPGANIMLENTSLGAATDLDGNYFILNVPSGTYTLTVKYIGYISQSYQIIVPDKDATIEQDAKLEYRVLEGEEVLITAQSEGQIQAINQQITSNTIKNIVSSSKIQELPESNGAEAVGRLPGISLQREGGEGNKVVIRGFSPQFNKIEINGITMAATGQDDRSVDLSMISPNILEGIEVNKTAMADQEADQIGGTVNFLLRGAPEKPTLNATLQGGYNGLRGETNNYYYVLGGGMRFFDNKFGVFVQGNLEKTDRSSNSATADYIIRADTLTLTTTLNLQDIVRTNKRSGGVIVLDYDLPSTKFKLSNSINNIDINTQRRQENFDGVGRNHNYQAFYQERSLLTLLSTLNIEQTLGDFKVMGNLSYTQSKTDVPREIQMNAYENNAFVEGWSTEQQTNPFDFPSKAFNNIQNSKVNQFYGRNSKTLEEEEAIKLSIERGFETDFAGFNIKIGGDYKHKYKKYDFEQSEVPLGWDDMTLVRVFLTQRYNVTGYVPGGGDFPYDPFIDYNYDAGDFKAGSNYTISRVPNINTMLDAYDAIKNLKYVGSEPVGKTIWYDYTDSNLNDFFGQEDYYAAYILPTITFGSKTVTFIPGLRYEYTTTDYTANRSNGPGKPTDPFPFFQFTSKQHNEYLLPMIQLKYQVFDWFDIRASYTKTLARPNYNRLIPRWSATGHNINTNNIELKPAQSQNFDLYFSFYTQKIGLFSFGVFEKRIKDFSLYTKTFIIDASQIRPEWPSIVEKGGFIETYTNNPNVATADGLEVEWQSNFWFLPGILRGVVLNINYTYIDSKTKYPKFVPIYVRRPGPLPIYDLVGTDDQSYNDRLLDQPTHVLNFTVGFDYEGFSIRGSLQYKSDVFTSSDFYKDLRSTTDPLTLWNMKVRQKLPLEGLQVFLNVNNISKAVDQTSNFGTGWFTNRGYYGLSGDLGVTYILN